MMKRIVFVAIAVFVTVSLIVASQPQEMPKPLKEHEWLKQFVGEWDSEAETVMVPGQPPVKCKGSMSSRMLGEFWMVSDVTVDMMGMSFQAIHTVGYDPKTKKYIGSWIDSVMNHMWLYQGSVDATGKILTLEAEGPNMSKPGASAKYRDIYEFKSKDHFTMLSEMQGDDGKWNRFMSSNVTSRTK